VRSCRLCRITLPFFVGAGFFIHVDDLPVYLSWVRFISFHYYSFRWLMINEFADHSYPCAFAADAQSAAAAALVSNTTLPAADAQVVAAECALFDGNNVLQNQGINDHGMGAPIAGLILSIAVMYFIAWLFLRFRPISVSRSGSGMRALCI
jgi:hypothetical protein